MYSVRLSQALLALGVVDGPGNIDNIELARTESLEATASAGLLHADSNVLVGLLKDVGHDFRHRHERARAV